MHLNTPPDLPPAAGYSRVATVPAGSTLVHTSGQVPMAPDGTIAPAASSLVQVAGLVRPEFLIEVEAIAAIGGAAA